MTVTRAEWTVAGEPYARPRPEIKIAVHDPQQKLCCFLHDLTPAKARQFANDIIAATEATVRWRRENPIRKKKKA